MHDETASFLDTLFPINLFKAAWVRDAAGSRVLTWSNKRPGAATTFNDMAKSERPPPFHESCLP